MHQLTNNSITTTIELTVRVIVAVMLTRLNLDIVTYCILAMKYPACLLRPFMLLFRSSLFHFILYFIGNYMK